MIKTVLFFLTLFVITSAFTQEVDSSAAENLIQFTGVVFNENKRSIRYVSVINTNKNLGQTTNEKGMFSIVVSPRDIIEFSYVGFKLQSIIIPDSIHGNRYSKMIYLSTDTIFLKGATIRPIPERQKFRQVFMNLDIKGPEEAIAPHAGFIEREAPPREPAPTIMNPASLLFRGIEKLMEKTRKRKKAAKTQEWVPSD